MPKQKSWQPSAALYSLSQHLPCVHHYSRDKYHLSLSHACTHMQLVYRHACIPAGKRSAITGASMYVSSVQYISVKDCCIANCCYPVAAYNWIVYISGTQVRCLGSIPQLLHTFSHPFRGEEKKLACKFKTILALQLTWLTPAEAAMHACIKNIVYVPKCMWTAYKKRVINECSLLRISYTCNYYEHYTNFKTDVKNKHKLGRKFCMYNVPMLTMCGVNPMIFSY